MTRYGQMIAVAAGGLLVLGACGEPGSVEAQGASGKGQQEQAANVPVAEVAAAAKKYLTSAVPLIGQEGTPEDLHLLSCGCQVRYERDLRNEVGGDRLVHRQQKASQLYVMLTETCVLADRRLGNRDCSSQMAPLKAQAGEDMWRAWKVGDQLVFSALYSQLDNDRLITNNAERHLTSISVGGETLTTFIDEERAKLMEAWFYDEVKPAMEALNEDAYSEHAKMSCRCNYFVGDEPPQWGTTWF